MGVWSSTTSEDDEVAFTAFVVAHRGSLLRLAAVMLGRSGHDAEDLTQAALLRLARRWTDVAEPLAYTRQVLTRLAIDGARDRARRPVTVDLADGALDAIASEAPPIGAVIENRDELWRHLRRLPASQRRILALRYLADCTEVETALLVGVRVGTVKSQSHKALQKLRALLMTQEEAAHD